MFAFDILLQLLLRLLNDFDLGGRAGQAARTFTRNYVQDRWLKRAPRLVTRMAKENITLAYVTETRPNPPSGYVGWVVGRLWSTVLKGGLIVDAFRDALEPRITEEIGAELSETDHAGNVRKIIDKAVDIVF